MSLKNILLLSLGAIVLIIPLVVFIVFNNADKEDKYIKEYCDNLYFNWIDYPTTAPEPENVNMTDDVKCQLWEWFGYNVDGTMNEELYATLNYNFNEPFLYGDDYIGIPFSSNSGTNYRIITSTKGVYDGYQESLWGE